MNAKLTLFCSEDCDMNSHHEQFHIYPHFRGFGLEWSMLSPPYKLCILSFLLSGVILGFSIFTFVLSQVFVCILHV